jgi:hypothetical protein
MTWCPQCGPDVRVGNEDDCATCGCDAVGAGADLALAIRQQRDAWKAAAKALDLDAIDAARELLGKARALEEG